MKRAIGMKSALVNFDRTSEQPIDLGEAGDRDDVDQQRVAVRLGAGGDLRADLAGGAGLGLDHARLLDDRLEHGRERAADHIGGAAGRERIDEGDRARGIVILRMRRAGRERCGGGREPTTKLRLSMAGSSNWAMLFLS